MNIPTTPTSVDQRLDWLFKNILKPDGSEYSHPEVESGTQVHGYKVTAATVWNIRNGKTPNPGYLTLRALALFFGVSPGLFYEEALSTERLAAIKTDALLQRPLIREIAARSSTLDEASQQAILDMIRFISTRSPKAEDKDPGA